MLSSIFQHAWTLCIYLRQLGGQISITAGSQSLTPSQRPLLCCSSAAKRNQTSLFLRTTANCTTWDVVTTACTPTTDSYSSIVFIWNNKPRWRFMSTYQWQVRDNSKPSTKPEFPEWQCVTSTAYAGIHQGLEASKVLSAFLRTPLSSENNWKGLFSAVGPQPLLWWREAHDLHRAQATCHLPSPSLSEIIREKNLLTVLPQTTWPASSGDGDLLKLHGLLPCYPCAWTDRWSCPWTLLAVSSQDCPVLVSSVQSY